MGDEITFIDNCEICGKRERPCMNHHMIPRRLLNIIPKNRARKYEYWRVRICEKCNKFFHPENRWYKKMQMLEAVLKHNNIDIQKSLMEMNPIKVEVKEDEVNNQYGE